MSRKLIKQMRNEWRANLWLVIELFFVSVVMWYMVDYILGVILTLNEPMGHNTEDVCMIKLSSVPEGAATYDESAGSDNDSKLAQLRAIRSRIESNEYVEAVGLCNFASVPYSMSMMGDRLEMPDDTTMKFYVNIMYVSPEMVDVLQYQGANGLTGEDLKQILSDNRVLFPSVLPDSLGVEPEYLIDKVFYSGGGLPMFAGGYIQKIRRGRQESEYTGSRSDAYPVLVNIDAYGINFKNVSAICVRVKPGQGRKFVDYVKSHQSEFKVGNMFVSFVDTFDVIESKSIYEFTSKILRYSLLMLFLVSVIFLGVFSAFWFRTRLRVSEVGMRKVAGATSMSILRRFMSEGLVLLTLAIVPAVLVCVAIAREELNYYYYDYLVWWRMVISVGIVYAALAIVVMLSILFPAMKAMKLEAATALKDE